MSLVHGVYLMLSDDTMNEFRRTLHSIITTYDAVQRTSLHATIATLNVSYVTRLRKDSLCSSSPSLETPKVPETSLHANKYTFEYAMF